MKAKARQRAAVIFQVRSGQLTATAAAATLGISRQQYYQWEQRALSALLTSLDDQPTGRPKTPTDPEERRVIIGNGADVTLGLAARLHHGIIPGTRAAHGLGGFFPAENSGFLGGKFKLRSCGLRFLKLFGFKDEMGAAIKINAPVAGRAVGVLLNNRKLEKISFVGLRHAKQIAKAKQKWLRVGPLGCAGR